MNKRNILSQILLFLVGFTSMAQGDLPPPLFGPGDPPGAPIDSGIIILFAIALVYGIYIIQKKAKPLG